jgi:hypothetical protein
VSSSSSDSSSMSSMNNSSTSESEHEPGKWIMFTLVQIKQKIRKGTSVCVIIGFHTVAMNILKGIYCTGKDYKIGNGNWVWLFLWHILDGEGILVLVPYVCLVIATRYFCR